MKNIGTKKKMVDFSKAYHNGTIDMIISIKPKYVQRILAGNKKYEYRRVIFNEDVRNIFIYSTSPDKRIVGYFKNNGYIKGSLDEIWKKTKDLSGISEIEYKKYFYGKMIAYAIIIEGLVVFDKCHDQFTKGNNFIPPQSFKYIYQGDIL
jgi:predicted transcriptional regulator